MIEIICIFVSYIGFSSTVLKIGSILMTEKEKEPEEVELLSDYQNLYPKVG